MQLQEDAEPGVWLVQVRPASDPLLPLRPQTHTHTHTHTRARAPCRFSLAFSLEASASHTRAFVASKIQLVLCVCDKITAWRLLLQVEVHPGTTIRHPVRVDPFARRKKMIVKLDTAKHVTAATLEGTGLVGKVTATLPSGEAVGGAVVITAVTDGCAAAGCVDIDNGNGAMSSGCDCDPEVVVGRTTVSSARASSGNPRLRAPAFQG